MSTHRASIDPDRPDWLELVRQKVEGLSYGVVQIVVHDRTVTQIERTERTRVTAPVVRDAQEQRRPTSA